MRVNFRKTLPGEHAEEGRNDPVSNRRYIRYQRLRPAGHVQLQQFINVKPLPFKACLDLRAGAGGLKAAIESVSLEFSAFKPYRLVSSDMSEYNSP